MVLARMMVEGISPALKILDGIWRVCWFTEDQLDSRL